jgi:hypothetical protein
MQKEPLHHGKDHLRRKGLQQQLRRWGSLLLLEREKEIERDKGKGQRRGKGREGETEGGAGSSQVTGLTCMGALSSELSYGRDTDLDVLQRKPLHVPVVSFK